MNPAGMMRRITKNEINKNIFGLVDIYMHIVILKQLARDPKARVKKN